VAEDKTRTEREAPHQGRNEKRVDDEADRSRYRKLDVTIDRVSLEFENAAGWEDRVDSMTERAVGLLGRHLDEWAARMRLPGRIDIDAATAGPVLVDVGQASDAEIAEAIATAWLDALAERLRA
jgi:hypothetical protein